MLHLWLHKALKRVAYVSGHLHWRSTDQREGLSTRPGAQGLPEGRGLVGLHPVTNSPVAFVQFSAIRSPLPPQQKEGLGTDDGYKARGAVVLGRHSPVDSGGERLGRGQALCQAFL